MVEYSQGEEWERREYQYNQAGNVIRSDMYFRGELSIRDVISYNEKGELVEVIRNRDGQVESQQTVTYAADGTIIKLSEITDEGISTVSVRQEKYTMTREQAEKLQEELLYPHVIIEGDPVPVN